MTTETKPLNDRELQKLRVRVAELEANLQEALQDLRIARRQLRKPRDNYDYELDNE